MSFVYNKKLSEELMKIGRKDINKWGQAADYEFEPGDVLNVAKTLLNNLGTEIQGSTQKIETLGGQEAIPAMKDLVSLNNLESFLAGEQVLAGGKRIAEFAGVEKDLKVNSEGLKEYLVKLRTDAIESKNKLFILLVGKIIKQANDKYKLNIDPAIEEASATDVNVDNTVLDTVPFLIKFDDFEKNGKQLTGKDLKDQKSFGAWLQAGTKSQIYDQAKGWARDIIAGDICSILNYLFKRSEVAAKGNLSGEKTQFKNIYVSLLQKFASQINCVITGAPSPSAGDKAGAGAVAGGANKTINIITQKLISVMPFEDNAIDLDKILSFINGYAAMFQDKNIEEELGHYDTLKTLYPTIVNLRNSIIAKAHTHRFEWNTDIHMVKQSLINKFGKDFHIAKNGISELKEIIDAAKSSVGVLMQSSIAKSSPDLIKMLNKQIDLANDYFSDLNTLEWEMKSY